jgi:uncharacterized protein YndB with AHSA1/START domain
VVPERIEREIVIDAPVEVVWSVVTEPEHIAGWFSDAAELDLQAGGRLALRWNHTGAFLGRVERVEPPHFLSFRWVVEPGRELDAGNSTLVEFSLRAEGDSTRLTVVETGFQALAAPDDEKQRHLESHRHGWERELGELAAYAGRRAT